MMRMLAAVGVAFLCVGCGGGDDSDDEALDALVDFARAPSEATWARLRLADDVELGLGHHLRERRARQELRDPVAWRISSPRVFCAAVGPFSPLEVIARSRDVEYVDGAYYRCVSPPAPPQPSLASLHRRSIQPKETESCLQWFAVDVYLTDEDEIAAVTLDFWEP